MLQYQCSVTTLLTIEYHGCYMKLISDNQRLTDIDISIEFLVRSSKIWMKWNMLNQWFISWGGNTRTPHRGNNTFWGAISFNYVGNEECGIKVSLIRMDKWQDRDWVPANLDFHVYTWYTHSFAFHSRLSPITMSIGLLRRIIFFCQKNVFPYKCLY